MHHNIYIYHPIALHRHIGHWQQQQCVRRDCPSGYHRRNLEGSACSEAAKGNGRARSLLGGLLQICEVVSIGREEVLQALMSKTKDFEDAVIESAALRARVDYIATRNLADFKSSKVPAKEPSEILP